MKPASSIEEGVERMNKNYSATIGGSELFLWAGLATLFLSGVLLIWVVRSSFEARAFNRVTGKQVTTWDAMWIELHVIEVIEGAE